MKKDRSTLGASSGVPRQPSSAEVSSTELAERAGSGDPAALERLCARYLPRVQRWARGVLPARARGAWDTGDLASETLARAARRIGSFDRTRGAFGAFVNMLLRNRAVELMRYAGRRPAPHPLDESRPDPAPSPLRHAIGQEGLEHYRSALARLKEAERELIEARFERELSFEEMARERGTTYDAVRMGTNRALAKLRRELEREAVRLSDGRPAKGSRDDRTVTLDRPPLDSPGEPRD